MVLSLSACGGKSNPGGGTGGKTPLTIWHIQTGTMIDVVQDSVDRFVAENPQYEVTVVQKQNGSYKTDLSLAINAGTMPDIFITWGGRRYMTMWTRGWSTI